MNKFENDSPNLLEYILNEQHLLDLDEEYEYDDEEDEDTLSSNEELDDLLSSADVVPVDEDVKPTRRLRRQSPDFFDVVTPDYDVIDGLYIKNLREGINVTRKVFAQIIGVTEDTVVDWEDDVRRPNNCALRLLYLMNNHIKIVGDLFDLQMKNKSK